MKYEYCCNCSEPTGKAGAGDDSLYTDHDGPFCEDCFPDKERPQRKEPEQEPLALEEKFSLLLWDYQELKRAFEKITGGKWVRKSNTPQRTWVGLTDEEENEYNYLGPDMHWVIQEIEAKLKEKNNG